MKRIVVTFAFGILSFATAFAQPTEIVVQERETALKQLQLAEDLAAKVLIARTPADREQTTLAAIAATRLVRKKWPNDVAAVLRAAFMEADLWQGLGAAENVAKALEPYRKIVKGSDNEASLYRRLGAAYEMLDRASDAEGAFDIAEKSIPKDKHPQVALAVFQASGKFYAGRGLPKEAAKRYRQVVRDDRQQTSTRALFALNAAREHLRAQDKSEARNDVQHARAFANELRSKGSDRLALQVEQEIERLVTKLN